MGAIVLEQFDLVVILAHPRPSDPDGGEARSTSARSLRVGASQRRLILGCIAPSPGQKEDRRRVGATDRLDPTRSPGLEPLVGGDARAPVDEIANAERALVLQDDVVPVPTAQHVARALLPVVTQRVA